MTFKHFKDLTAADRKHLFVDGLVTLLEQHMTSADAWTIALSLEIHMCHPYLHYHVPAHILALWHFRQHSGLQYELSLPQQLALWFHDAVYVPGYNGNERLSGLFMRSMLEPYFERTVIDVAEKLILATSDHNMPNGYIERLYSAEANLVLDLDLSAFSYDTDEFLFVNECIRKEFRDVNDDEFYSNRKKFLQTLAVRGNFYRTEIFKPFEAKAIANLNSLL